MESKIIVVVTPREKDLYDSICELGDWVSRKDLAVHQNKFALSPHDFQLLERLVEKGLIEKMRYSEYEYSMKGQFMYRALPLGGGVLND